MGNPVQKSTLIDVFGNCVGNSIPLTLPMNFTKVFKLTPKINVEELIKVNPKCIKFSFKFILSF